MAGIAGIYCADGRPADLAEVRRMTAAVGHRGPDGVTYWQSGPVAFAHLQLCTTPESLDERQPLASSGGEVCLVWDGRIDNREELLEALGAQGARPESQTDPDLVLAAYLAWGEECVQRVVGDFALAVWDARSRRLWCARDYVGVRPFYYFWDGKTFLFGPELRALLAHPLVSLKINEGMAGEYLADSITSREETLYADIQRLPPAFTLTIDASGSLRTAFWWKPDLSLLVYRTDEEYAEQFRHWMSRSVRSRMRCSTPWGVQLSGGLDSSTISVTAQDLLNRGGFRQDRVLTFSLASQGKPWDETEFIAETAQHAGLQAEYVLPFRAELDHYRQRAASWRDFPGYPNGEPMSAPIYEAARRHGARVLLNGLGGNELLDGRFSYLSDLAMSGSVRALIERAKADWRMYRRQRHWSLMLAHQLMKDMAPHWAIARKRSNRLSRTSILSQEFLRRTALGDRLYARPKNLLSGFSSRAQKEVFDTIAHGFLAHAIEMNNIETGSAGFEPRYPFYDRRFAEFCLRIPEEQRRTGGTGKWILRNAMRGYLPERVRTKRYQAEFSELFETVFYSPATDARLKNLAMRKHTDWFDHPRLESQLEVWRRPESFQIWPSWTLLGMDLWFEQVRLSGGNA